MSSDGERMWIVSRRVMRGFDPQRLMDARIARGFSRGELGRKAQVGEATIHQWETRGVSPQVDLLDRVATELGANVGDFVRVPESERFPGDWRILRGLTQPQLGARAGISTAMIGRIERGDVTLTTENEEKLARALRLPASELRASYERARQRPPGTPA